MEDIVFEDEDIIPKNAQMASPCLWPVLLTTTKLNSQLYHDYCI